MVELKKEPIKRSTLLQLFVFSTAVTTILIIFVLMLLNDFSLDVIEGSWIMNLVFITTITFFFNLLFLRSELKKSQFNSVRFQEDKIIINRDKKASELDLDTVRYFNLDQHFYRLIGHYRFTIVSGSHKKTLETFIINKAQLRTLSKTKEFAQYVPLWRETKKKETP